MFGKFLIIALVCVSVAQVYGDELQDAINNAVGKVSSMNEFARNRYYDVVKGGNYNERDIAYRSQQIVQRAEKVQETSRQAMRNVSAVIEEKAKENKRPESILQCLRTTEERANNEINTFTTKFETDIDRLLSTKKDIISFTMRPVQGLDYVLQDNLDKATDNIRRCANIRCINNVVGGYAGFLNSQYATMQRVEEQVTNVVTTYQRDAQNYYINFNRQVTRVRSTAIRALKMCAYKAERDVFDIQDFEEVQEF